MSARARRLLLALIGAIPLALLAGPVADASAMLVMEKPTGGTTKVTTPTFSGTSEDLVDPVTVVIHEGASLAGPELPALSAPVSEEGTWSVTAESLPDGTYTAIAEQTETGGMGQTATAGPVTFTIDTKPPHVTLKAPPSPSGDTTPVFEGNASESSTVTIKIYEGPNAGDEAVASATAEGNGGEWISNKASPALSGGEYTAVAIQVSTIGNGPGESLPVHFVVDTESPVVTLTQPETPSDNTEPSFSGTASETTEVVVHVFEGPTEVAKAKTTASGGNWSTNAGDLSNPLPSGKHTFKAYAIEKSGLGNKEGQSETKTFVVDTEVPEVTLNQPETPSANTEPSFSGAASEATEVTVHVFEGATEVAKAKTVASGGNWSTTASDLSNPLPKGKHTFKAYAIEKSGVGNKEGQSETKTFVVDTEGPEVTLAQPKTPSDNTEPSFSGTASEATEVVVHVFEGATEVAKAKTTASGGNWSTTASDLTNPLPSGKHTFTAYAIEKSGLGSKEGQSETKTFVVNTEPPEVTLKQPETPSNHTEPSFSGTASEATEVVVHVFEGPTEVAKAKTTASGGSWSTNASELTDPLPSGKHTFTAYAIEKSGLGSKEGQSETKTFVVDTEVPEVTLKQPETPSNNIEPSFSGTASEATEVVVHVFEGATEVAKAKTTASGGSWSTTASELSNPLPKGKHTFKAYAIEKSGVGNKEGQSETKTFVVNTETPEVTLAQPKTPSDNTEPSFSGTASEATEVVVHVFEGATEVAKAKTTASGGSWSTNASDLSNPLPKGKHTFTAYAIEKSGLGNKEGQSETKTFVVNTEPPEVTLKQPETPSDNREPSFSGTASEATEVVVHVFEGSTEVAKAKTTASGGSWSTSASALSNALPSGKRTFTAYAIEKSGIGNKEGQSETKTFVVNTEPPEVTLAPVPARTSETRPSFNGTASENTEVVVHVFEGSNEIAKAKTTASNGSWSTNGSALSKALPEGKHSLSVYATEKSGLGNDSGTSAPQSFEVDTEPPEVTLAQPKTPSNNVEPSFSGTASEATEVVVHVFEGSTEVAKAKTTASGGSWSTSASALSNPLPKGKHTFKAYAIEKSGIGDKEGQSETKTFVVNTEPPEVTLKQPETPSKNVEPSFSGTASEATEVVVHIFEGPTEVAKAKTTASGGNWSTTSSGLSNPLPKGKRTFTAYAIEQSGLGNKEGQSETKTFVVNTEPPEVTLKQPETPSKNVEPSFSGTASEATEVVVHIFEGPTEVAKAKTTASGGSWSTSASELSNPLSKGKHTFTAYAIEKSGLGNKEGQSETKTFVVNTEPPEVTLTPPKSPSSETKPSFGGTASENTEVEVHVFAGSKGEGEEVASAKTTASGGSWTTTSAELTKALSEGKHAFSAYATEVSGLGNKPGKSSTVLFEVDTEPPTVTLNQPKTPSSITNPSFSGTASEAGPAVTVDIYEGKKVEGEPVTSVTSGVNRSSEDWTAGPAKLATGKHFYTAIAIEPSGLGNKPGESKPVTFEVNTLPPTVTLESLPLRSDDTTPSFSGTTNEAGQITVELNGETTVTHENVKQTFVIPITGKEGGAWKTSSTKPPLEEGKYTVIAREPSTIENGEGKLNEEGKSKVVTFEVVLGAPTVKLNEIARSRNTQPSFSGTAEDKTPVTVKIYEGTSATGNIISTASEAGARKGEVWTSGKASPALPTGRHIFTAVAVEKNEIEGDPPGESEPQTFEVDTEPPTVTLNQPKTPSNQTKPSFSGTASESTEVKVHVFAGSKGEGEEVASAKTTASGGSWTTTGAQLTKALQEGKRTFTAYATEKSEITGNEEGKSAPVTFEVDTEPPKVTLNSVPSPANDAEPSFSGTASDTTPVTVSVYAGGAAGGSPVAWIEAVGADGLWGPYRLGAPNISHGDELLPNGEYTAVATQPSSLGNPTGVSPKVTFIVETRPPTVVALPAVIFSRTSVELNASINPNEGALSACGFEYGTTPAYGTALECAFNGASGECTFSASATGACEFPADEGAVPVYARLFHPSASTTYYFRITAADGEQGASATGTFTTPASLNSGDGGSSGGSGGSNTATTSTAHNAVGEVEAAIAAHLPPSGRNATIAALLKHGGFASLFKAPQAGTAVIDWWYLPPGAKLSAKAASSSTKAASKKKAPAPVLVASGKRTFYEAGSGLINLHLTAAGRSLLKHSKRVRLTAKAVFTAGGKTAYAASKTFELK